MGPRKRAAASRSTEEDGEAGGGGSKDARKDAAISTKASKTTVAKKSTSRKRASAATEGDKKEERGTSSEDTAASEEEMTKKEAATTKKATTAKKATTPKKATTAKKAAADRKVPAARKPRKAKKPPKPKRMRMWLQSEEFTKVYQFKITLMYIEPPIWRRIQVPEDYTFRSLHEAIRDAMGWNGLHMHHFVFEADTTIFIGPPSLMDDKIIPEADTKISDYFTDEKRESVYEYDFGDSWQHHVMFEEVVEVDPEQLYPRCLDGARACPPEDVGGIEGYEHLLEVIKTPPKSRDEDMKELLEWLYDQKPYEYDPDFFDVEYVAFEDIRAGGFKPAEKKKK